MTLQLAIHGAAGRMGQRLVALGSADISFKLVAALDSSKHSRAGEDAGTVAGVGPIGVPLSPEWKTKPDVVIDFSVPAATGSIVARCLAEKIPLVVATTGLESETEKAIREAAKTIPVVWAPSMSLAVNLTMKLVETAAKALKTYPGGADVEIIERHHRFKEDSPSGTAIRFGEIVAGAMGQTKPMHGREGRPGARTRDEIGFHAVRTGDNPGEHTIIFGMLGETIELNVAASNRDCYAAGALAAAKWLAGKPAGLYGMTDVLGL